MEEPLGQSQLHAGLCVQSFKQSDLLFANRLDKKSDEPDRYPERPEIGKKSDVYEHLSS